MLPVLMACNIVAGFAIALTFYPRAIVVAAPVMAGLNVAVLIASGHDIMASLLITALYLFAGQFAFLLGTAMMTRARDDATQAPRHGLGKEFES